MGNKIQPQDAEPRYFLACSGYNCNDYITAQTANELAWIANGFNWQHAENGKYSFIVCGQCANNSKES